MSHSATGTQSPQSYSATFGAWLKQRRKEQSISPDQFAELIGCSAITLHKIEAGERRPSRQLAELLAEHLHVPPDEWEPFVAFARMGRINSAEPASEVAARAPWRAVHSRLTNLPSALTSFVGREEDLQKARDLLLQRNVRLLTLTGAPGIGKTRLALQVAADLLDTFEDGVYLVELAPASDPDLLLDVIARTLSLKSDGSQPVEEILLKHLSERRTLLVLDNFEHLLDAAPSVVRLLEGSPLLKVLATSREMLHVRGERRLPVPPLSVPEQGHLQDIESLALYSSVALFVERAEAVSPDFMLTESNAADVAEICAGLEGLPLALELAAARFEQFSPSQMRASLKSRLNLLTGGERDLPLRQRTLRSAIGWSYSLLNKEEQQILRLLSTFVGGFTSEAAVVVCEGSAGDVQDRLTALVDKNLIRREIRAGETRYGMLEVIREYALQLLAENGEEDAVKLRYARYFLSLTELAYANQTGPRQLPLLISMDADYSNLIASLSWLLSNGHNDPAMAEMAALMASYLFYYWDWRGYFAEGREWIEQALTLGERVLWPNGVDGDIPTDVAARLLKIQGRLLNGAGLHSWSLGDSHAAMRLFNDALRVLTRLGNKQGMAAVLGNIAILEAQQGLYSQAVETYKQVLQIDRELGDDRIAVTLNNLGVAYWNSGDVKNAHAMYEESLARFRQMDDPGNMVLALDNLGIVAQYHGEYEVARRYQDEALAICRTYGYKNGLAHVLAHMGSRAVSEGDFASARKYYGELLRLLQQQNYQSVIISCLEGVATLSYKLGRPIEAARLWGAAERMREVNKHPISVLYIKRHEQNRSAALEQSDPEAFQSAWNKGRAMSIEEAMVCALECL
jgi:predicted ATPase/DNA-binding XRE family transcriptional regulator/Tfp pilus assembly protein PilF